MEQGGLLIGVEDTARLMIATGMVSGVRVADPKNLRVVGTVLDARIPDTKSPIVDGLGDRLSVYSSEGLSFELSSSALGGWAQEESDRPTGRGGPKDTDATEGRTPQQPRPTRAKIERWEARPLEVEELRNNPAVIPEALRPRTLVRFGDADELLVSGLLEHGEQLARRAAVVEGAVRQGKDPALRHQPDLARLDDRQPPPGLERDSGASGGGSSLTGKKEENRGLVWGRRVAGSGGSPRGNGRRTRGGRAFPPGYGRHSRWNGGCGLGSHRRTRG